MDLWFATDYEKKKSYTTNFPAEIHARVVGTIFHWGKLSEELCSGHDVSGFIFCQFASGLEVI